MGSSTCTNNCRLARIAQLVELVGQSKLFQIEHVKKRTFFPNFLAWRSELRVSASTCCQIYGSGRTAHLHFVSFISEMTHRSRENRGTVPIRLARIPWMTSAYFKFFHAVSWQCDLNREVRVVRLYISLSQLSLRVFLLSGKACSVLCQVK